jgi:hypothetical protein
LAFADTANSFRLRRLGRYEAPVSGIAHTGVSLCAPARGIFPLGAISESSGTGRAMGTLDNFKREKPMVRLRASRTVNAPARRDDFGLSHRAYVEALRVPEDESTQNAGGSRERPRLKAWLSACVVLVRGK